MRILIVCSLIIASLSSFQASAGMNHDQLKDTSKKLLNTADKIYSTAGELGFKIPAAVWGQGIPERWNAPVSAENSNCFQGTSWCPLSMQLGESSPAYWPCKVLLPASVNTVSLLRNTLSFWIGLNC